MLEEQKAQAVVEAHRDLNQARRDMVDAAEAIDGLGFHPGRNITNDDVTKLLRISFRLRELARGDR